MSKIKYPKLDINFNGNKSITIRDAYRVFSEVESSKHEYISNTTYLCNQSVIIDVKTTFCPTSLFVRMSLKPDTLSAIIYYDLCLYANIYWNALALHASSVKIKDKLIIFIGPSNSGKSFMAKLTSEKRGGIIISDDSLLLIPKNRNRLYATDIDNLMIEFDEPQYQFNKNKITVMYLINTDIDIMDYIIMPDYGLSTSILHGLSLLNDCTIKKYLYEKNICSASSIINEF